MNFAWWHLALAWLPMVPTFWSIWHIWNHSFPTFHKKMLWLILVVFLPVIGGIIYILWGRKYAMPLDTI